MSNKELLFKLVKFNNDWDEVLKGEFSKEYYKKLRAFLKEEYLTRTIYPPMDNIFAALKTTAYKDVSVVIIGQDPYHGKNEAHGLCFSVLPGCKLPPSLLNIYKEIESELKITMSKTGYLMPWAKQGVLLLNTVLTVRENSANSHKGMGWETFTDNVIKKINEREEPVVFLLWGANARAKGKLITNPNHLILSCAHPSPLSAYNGFFGCNHFIKANEFLKKNNRKEIDWQI